MTKTAEEKLNALKQYLTQEIEKSEAVLADPFLRANMYAMDLDTHAEKIGYYTQVLEKMENL
jgi:hypothetical protein